jgi:hypothetical protein
VPQEIQSEIRNITRKASEIMMLWMTKVDVCQTTAGQTKWLKTSTCTQKENSLQDREHRQFFHKTIYHGGNITGQ